MFELRPERAGITVHLGYMFGICVQKNSELSIEVRKYKGRVVFQETRYMPKIIIMPSSKIRAARPPLFRWLRLSTSLDACPAAL